MVVHHRAKDRPYGAVLSERRVRGLCKFVHISEHSSRTHYPSTCCGTHPCTCAHIAVLTPGPCPSRDTHLCKQWHTMQYSPPDTPLHTCRNMPLHIPRKPRHRTARVPSHRPMCTWRAQGKEEGRKGPQHRRGRGWQEIATKNASRGQTGQKLGWSSGHALHSCLLPCLSSAYHGRAFPVCTPVLLPRLIPRVPPLRCRAPSLLLRIRILCLCSAQGLP